MGVAVDWLYAALLGYLVGSIPFGLLLTRLFGAGDIRTIGSGSIGATNVLRTGRKGLAAATVLLDAGKGAMVVLLATRYLPGSEGVAAVAAVVGHCFPVWLKFRGGKGFATAAGICLVLAWPAFLVSAAVWGLMIGATRISSVASMTSVIIAPLASLLLDFEGAAKTLVAIAVIVLVQHRANIARLLKGEETRVGSKS
ncbi:MAG TPA: glycerol-3-phosphate 1-O-acyltransferase PlsY [Croceibacterium sp.]|nr:glycerol-3-phosphate 1-O-acyltransferase PlsY [Croceibacterium sp.]